MQSKSLLRNLQPNNLQIIQKLLAIKISEDIAIN